MKPDQLRRTRTAAGVGAAVLAMSASQAFASAFALQEQSGSGLGNAFAGGAAAAQDASTVYTNPAGMALLPGMQIVGSGTSIHPSAKFHDDGSVAAAFQPLGGTGGDAGGAGLTGALLPAGYFAMPLNSQWWIGVGANTPFGLKTEYDSDWLGRFQAVKSEVKTVNVNPAASYRINDMVTLGVGINWQRIDATLDSHINYAAAFAQGVQQGVAAGKIPAAAAPVLINSAAGLESQADITGDDTAWGWNIGALFQLDQATRIGVAYRSKIKYTVNGNADFNHPTTLGALPPTLAPVGAAIAAGVNAALFNGPVTLALEVPDSANISFFKQLDSRWDVMADVQYTGWSSVQELRIVRDTGVTLAVTPENFRDTWRASVGANYHWTPEWMFRGGIAYDQSPVRDAERTPRLPDGDRTWFSFGVQYRFSPQFVVDGGYTYISVKDPSINQNAGSTAANGLINGTYKSNVNIGSIQVTYTFN